MLNTPGLSDLPLSGIRKRNQKYGHQSHYLTDVEYTENIRKFCYINPVLYIIHQVNSRTPSFLRVLAHEEQSS